MISPNSIQQDANVFSLRPYAEGCATTPVAFLEAWFVSPERRRRGVGRALVATAEAWARGRGCHEFANRPECGMNPGQAGINPALVAQTFQSAPSAAGRPEGLRY